MKKIILISILFTICSFVVGQEIKDSIPSPDVKKWHSNFGISLSCIGISKQKTNTFSTDAKDIFNYSSKFAFGNRYPDNSLYNFIPEISFILNTNHKNYIFINELSYSSVHTEYSFDALRQFSNPNYLGTSHYIYDFNYTLLNYKFGIGFRYKKIIVIPGLQAGYVFYEYYNLKEFSKISDVTGQSGLKYIFGLNCKVGVQLSKKWIVEGVFFKQFLNNHSFGIAEKYSISTIELSVTKIFYRKHKK